MRWAVTHRQIINKALLAIGSSPVTGVIGTTDPIHIAVAAAYEGAWREVLESNAWSDLLVLSSLDADTDADGMYRFTIPADCVHVISIKTAEGSEDRLAIKRGSYIWSPQEELRVTYLSGDGIIPVDMADIDTDLVPPSPSVMVDAVAYRLASSIAFVITQNTALQSSLELRYHNTLSIAKYNDTRPSGGEDFWGHRAIDDEL